MSALASLPPIRLCPNGHEAEACAELVAALFAKGSQGDKNNRLCPLHDDRKASLSFNAGKRGMWLVWCCGGGCDPDGDRIRDEALGRGADPGCLGKYGLPKRTTVPGLRVISHDPVLVADAKRWHAILKLDGAGLDYKLYRMCVQAIKEGDGDLPGDPLALLPINSSDFYGLASRAGLGRYKYELFGRWLRSAA